MNAEDEGFLRDILVSDSYNEVKNRTYIALDVPSTTQALAWIDTFGDIVDGYKVGLQLFHANGQKIIDSLLERGKRVFLDVKLHDIPNTVAGTLQVICDSPVEMVNVHALGGQRMLEAARNAVDGAHYHPLLIAVTLLTSISGDELFRLGFTNGCLAEVQRLTALSERSGMDGVVASAQELSMIRQVVQRKFETVIPGTRPHGANLNDQKRTMTPGEAMALGASRLVIGRAVLKADRPLAALKSIWDDMRAHIRA